MVAVYNPPTSNNVGGDLSGALPNPTVTKASGAFTVAGNVGFYGGAAVARPAGYTQTYPGSSRTHANATATAASAATAAAVAATAATNVAAFGYQQAQADQIPVAINALITDNVSLRAQIAALVTDVANAKNVLNQVLTDIRATGLLA